MASTPTSTPLRARATAAVRSRSGNHAATRWNVAGKTTPWASPCSDRRPTRSRVWPGDVAKGSAKFAKPQTSTPYSMTSLPPYLPGARPCSMRSSGSINPSRVFTTRAAEASARRFNARQGTLRAPLGRAAAGERGDGIGDVEG